MEVTRVLAFPCMVLTPLIYTLASCCDAVPWHCLLAVGLDVTSLQQPPVQTKHCLLWLVSLVPAISGLCLKCHVLLIQLYVSLTHIFIVKINIFWKKKEILCLQHLFIVVAKWYFGDSPFLKSASEGANPLSKL